MALVGDDLPSASSNQNPNLYRVFGLSFTLLCVLQAVLNISLRLTVYTSDGRILEYEAIIKNLSDEGDELKRKLSIFDHYSQHGWVYFNHSFYYISSFCKSWQESRDDCLQRGADLVIINSKEEQEFTRQFKRLTWIGLTDRETEGAWKWVDGTSLSTSPPATNGSTADLKSALIQLLLKSEELNHYWHTGEPNSFHGRDEDCGEVRYFDSENSWNDFSCNKESFWICEKMVVI